MDLSERKLKILSYVVNSYVKFGEPVSSKAICSFFDTQISSATIRNEMAELTELGLLEQPYTSAGRIPSQLGYRVYINNLMEKKTISIKNRRIIDETLSSRTDTPENLLKKAAKLLANITNFAVVATAPSIDKNVVKSIQFVQTGLCSAMLVILSSSGTVKNRFFKCNFALEPKTVDAFNFILRKNFAGVLLSDITNEYVKKVSLLLGSAAIMLNDILYTVVDAVREIEMNDIHAEGQMNLLLLPEFSPESAMGVIQFLKRQSVVENLLFDRIPRGTNVLIGEETHIDELSKSSVIVTKYSVSGKHTGSIGIIGPTRMDYGSLIANLEYLADSVSGMLEDILDLE